MIARSFRPVGWVAAVGAAALGCYMLSLRVAAERADLDRLDSRIVAASQNIRSLQTELGTRGRMQQLEAWNEEVLALSAPISGQFVEGSVSLARFDTRQPQIAPDAEVRLASAGAPALATPPPAAAPAAIVRPAVAAPAQAQAQPLVRRASATVPAQPPKAVAQSARSEAPRQAAPPPAATAAARQPIPAAATPPRTRTASADQARRPPTAAAAGPQPRQRQAGLLDDRTIRDLSNESRSERRGGTGN